MIIVVISQILHSDPLIKVWFEVTFDIKSLTDTWNPHIKGTLRKRVISHILHNLIC